MSNSLAIAAITSTLQKLLDEGVKLLDDSTTPDPELTYVHVTTLPPDRARDPSSDYNQVNLFLYRTAINGAFRNMDIPRRVLPGETGQPPLALNLFYLITAYGSNNDEVLSHRLLGRALRILQDHPLLTKSDLLSEDQIKDLLSESGVDAQPEYVRIIPQSMSLEEMSKLWMMFQTNYRISVAYQVEVALIEGTRRTRTPLPVLKPVPIVQPNLVPPYPTLESIIPPKMQPSIRLDDDLIIRGHHLEGDIIIRFSNPRLRESLEKQLPNNRATEIKVKPLDIAPEDKWVAGFYTISISVVNAAEPDRTVTTNGLPIALAPAITTELPMDVDRKDGNATITLNCSPPVLPEQRASLLLGDREIPSGPHPLKVDNLTFDIKSADPGRYFVRLRVDGVDSLLIQTDDKVTPPVHTFYQTQVVNIKE